ncbi:hypothetical protein GCM10023145_23570 [Angustibacter luteus]
MPAPGQLDLERVPERGLAGPVHPVDADPHAIGPTLRNEVGDPSDNSLETHRHSLPRWAP